MKKIILIFLFLSFPASASIQRSVSVGVPFGFLVSSPSFQGNPFGTGLWLSYDFHISERFNIGMLLTHRWYPGLSGIRNWGFGILLGHYFWGPSDFRPYLGYGLLQQMIFIGGREGSGMAHDTRLAIGTDLFLFEQVFFVDLSYHIVRLRYFENEAINLDFLQLILGWRHFW